MVDMISSYFTIYGETKLGKKVPQPLKTKKFGGETFTLHSTFNNEKGCYVEKRRLQEIEGYKTRVWRYYYQMNLRYYDMFAIYKKKKAKR